ncbi:MAG: hypothetical protein IJV34_01000 [Prevotella sp.]|nr:hypothetical protein [Prevotella sp.]
MVLENNRKWPPFCTISPENEQIHWLQYGSFCYLCDRNHN